jgi:hypothetical protein
VLERFEGLVVTGPVRGLVPRNAAKVLTWS